MIVVMTAPRTGTHYTSGVVARLTGGRAAWLTPVHPHEFEKTDITVLVTHAYVKGFKGHADAIFDLVMASDCPLVVPLRDPLAALITQIENTHRNDGLTTVGHARTMARLATGIDRPVFYFNVHGPLDSLARYLGVPCKDIPPFPRNETEERRHSKARERLLTGDRPWDLYEEEYRILKPLKGFYADHGIEL